MRSELTAVVVAAFSLANLFTCLDALAQDVVILQGQQPGSRVKKRGEIVEWAGGELRLRGPLNREEVLRTDRVLDVQSAWTSHQQQAEQLRGANKSDEAIAAWRRAYQEEQRPWARRRILAELAVAFLETGRPDLAGDAFLSLVASDPQTHLFDTAPISWRAVSPDAALQQRAAAWLASSEPTARLLGASWLLTTSQRSAALPALEELTRHDDRRLAAAAEIQLWRTRLVTATPVEIARWKTAAEKVPSELRGVAWYLIGEALARHNESEEAALAYLQTALTYNRQRALAADALVQAAGELEKLKRPEQAAGLYLEVLSAFPLSPAALRARERLESLREPPGSSRRE